MCFLPKLPLNQVRVHIKDNNLCKACPKSKIIQNLYRKKKEKEVGAFTTKIHSNSIHVTVISCPGYGVRTPVTIGNEVYRNIGDDCETKQGNWPCYPS